MALACASGIATPLHRGGHRPAVPAVAELRCCQNGSRRSARCGSSLAGPAWALLLCKQSVPGASIGAPFGLQGSSSSSSASAKNDGRRPTPC